MKIIINFTHRRTVQNAGSILYRGTKNRRAPSRVSIPAGGPPFHIQVKSITRTKRVMRDSWVLQRIQSDKYKLLHQYSLSRDDVDGICLNVLRRDIQLMRNTWPPNVLSNGELPKAIMFTNDFSSQLVDNRARFRRDII